MRAYEASFNADQAKLQKMQNDAQKYMAGLQQNIQNEVAQNTQQLTDSITNFMTEYAKQLKIGKKWEMG